MSESTVIHDTFLIERTYPAPAEQVFAYFADPTKKRRWYAESDGHEVEVFDMDFQVGGMELFSYRMGPKTPFPGVVLASDGRFEDIAPDRRVVIASTMSLGGRRISTTLVTFELFGADRATRVVLTHQGVFYEGSGGPQMRKDGWEALLDRLGRTMAQ
jgi:uncharacterized protein YndB with AHSA1/START domain